MKLSTYRSVAAALSIALMSSSISVFAAGGGIAPNTPARVSDRMIIKYKANPLPIGLSVAQIHAQLMQPLTAQTMSQLQTVAGAGLTELHSIQNGAHVLAVAGQPNRQVLENAMAAIRTLPNVEYVEEDRILMPQAVPNDTYYTSATSGGTTYPGLWGMWPVSTVASPAPGGTGSYGADFETAWASATGSGVVVAVVDTGITPSLDIVGPGGTVAATGNLVSIGYDFITDCRMRASCPANTAAGSAVVAASPNAADLGDWISAQDKTDNANWTFATVSDSSWHGTHVAGTIAALGNNYKGVIGGAYNARILPVRVLGKGGGYLSDIMNGALWAAGVHPTISNPNPAKVINMSLAGSGACTPTIQNAVDSVVAAGAVVIVAAGNSDVDVANTAPANCQNVIVVAATGRDGRRAPYSNFSSPASNTTNPINITLAAPGGDQSGVATFDLGILSTINTGLTTPTLTGGTVYQWYEGTSMATPHVAAAAALMLSKNPNLTPAQIKTILSSSASLTAFPSFDPGLSIRDCALNQNCGAGILNANLAVQNSTPFVTSTGTSNYGSVVVNGTGSRTMTLTNAWIYPAQAGTASISGTSASQFSIGTDTCSGNSLAVGATCQITVNYVPTVAGSHVGSLSVPFTGAGATTPALVSLTGTSLATLTTSDVTAPSVTIGGSTTVNLTFTNPNVNSASVAAITLSQPSIMAASIDHCSNTTLTAGASCMVTVTITPSAAGAYSGTASLSLSAGGVPTVATISGTANAASSGGGGCSVMPFGAKPDMSLLFALLALAVYGLGRRVTRKQ